MSRSSTTCCVMLFLTMLVPMRAAPVGEAADPKPAKKYKPHELRDKLNTRVNLEKGIDVNTPLLDALEYLSETYDFPLIIDSAAFERIGIQKVEEQQVSLPKMNGVRMSTVLKLLLGQVKGDEYKGTIVFRGDHIEATTTYHASTDRWLSDPSVIPVVNVDFDRTPLTEALREVADQCGINLVFDVRQAELARKPVTAALSETRADTAVRLLADMVDLKMIVVDNVVYVTSKENARELEAEQAKIRKEREASKGVMPEPENKLP